VNEAPKPNPALTDDQWNGIKKDFVAQAHDTLGVVAVAQKKFDVAINEFKMSMEGAATPDMATPIRLASAYTDAGKFDESSATLEKVLATPGLPDAFKHAATSEKARVEKARAAKK